MVSAAAAIAAGLLTRRLQLARAAQETQKLLVELGGEAYTARASHGGIHQFPDRGHDFSYSFVLSRSFLVEPAKPGLKFGETPCERLV